MIPKALQIQHSRKLIRLISVLQRFYFSPTYLGTENLIAKKPAMYVGNHTLYGVLDSPMLIDYLLHEHNIAVVSLADHLHFHVPLWRDMVQRVGAIDGIPAYARQAMQQGYSILVFPGGGREVVKRKGEAYQLIWKQRYGFLKLAQEFNYEIAPFVALGGDEAFDIALDANGLLRQNWFQKLLSYPKIAELLRDGDIIPPIPQSILPKRIPFYFKFLPRLSVKNIQTVDELVQFRADLQQQIYAEIAQLKLIRQQDTGIDSA